MTKYKSPLMCLLATLACCAMLLLGAVSAKAASTATPWKVENLRCLRPFSSMESFGDITKTPREQNCDFHFFSATAASVSLVCDGPPGSGTVGGCNATMEIDMVVPDDVAARLAARTGAAAGDRERGSAEPLGGGATLDQDDLWRYEFQLAAVHDGTTVLYKGFSGEGYSLCCDGMTSGAANCLWMEQDAGDNDLADEDADGVEDEPQQRRLVGCPLPLPSPRRHAGPRGAGGAADAHGGPPVTFQVRVTKPLPRVIAGLWEARMQFSRKRREGGDREDVGRVIVAFDVQPATLWAGGHVRNRGDSDAAAVVSNTAGGAAADL